MNVSPPSPRDWELERLLLGELSEARAQALKSQLAQDPALQQRLNELKRSSEELLKSLPPRVFAQEVSRRRDAQARVQAAAQEPSQKPTASHKPSHKPLWAAVFSTTVTAALAGFVLLHAPESNLDSDGPNAVKGAHDPLLLSAHGENDVTRAKGLEPQLRIYRLEGDRITRLLDSAAVPSHARVQLSYLTPGKPYGVLLSIDGAGKVTLHQPTAATEEARLDPSGEHQLPFSYELDEAPAFERFFLVSADKPVAVTAVVAAAEKLAQNPQQAKASPLPLPAEIAQTSLLLEKVNP